MGEIKERGRNKNIKIKRIFFEKPKKVRNAITHQKEIEIKKLCHRMTILAIRPLTRSLHNLGKTVFLIVTHRRTWQL